jgi:thiol-disulfide isomerase/thioredoxin
LLGGADVQFSELLGKQPIVLNFWAGLCPPCRAEMPDLQAMYDANHGEVLLFGLDVGPFVGLGSREDGKRLLEELKVTFPTGTTLDAQVVRNYKLVGMPTTYFIKPDGTIHRQWAGLLNKKKLDELVKELVTASKRPKG